MSISYKKKFLLFKAWLNFNRTPLICLGIVFLYIIFVVFILSDPWLLVFLGPGLLMVWIFAFIISDEEHPPLTDRDEETKQIWKEIKIQCLAPLNTEKAKKLKTFYDTPSKRNIDKNFS